MANATRVHINAYWYCGMMSRLKCIAIMVISEVCVCTANYHSSVMMKIWTYFTYPQASLGASIVQQGHPAAVDLCTCTVAHGSKISDLCSWSNVRWGSDIATESPNLTWISCRQCYSAPLTILALPTHDLITLHMPIFRGAT